MRRSAAAVAVLGLATPVAAAPPANLTNARIEARSAAPGLAGTVKSALTSRSGPHWIGWAVPTQGGDSACCWSRAEKEGQGGCFCLLEAEGEGVFRSADKPGLPLEGARRLRVLLRADGGRVRRVRAYSEDCGLDAGGLAFLWLEDVRPAESVSLLATYLGTPGGDEDLQHGALAAIAFHADPAADATLEGLVDPREPLECRREAAFWLGHARGRRGYQVLARLVRDDADPRFREHAVFAVSQSREPAAVDTIIEVARQDASAGVRGQALFWLAQTAAGQAPRVIETALKEDPDVEVKNQAVFALSQLPRDEGVPLLIRLARTHRVHQVRQQAMFWLGQSGDPRALAFFEEVLGR
jgi:hypothetical protein